MVYTHRHRPIRLIWRADAPRAPAPINEIGPTGLASPTKRRKPEYYGEIKAEIDLRLAGLARPAIMTMARLTEQVLWKTLDIDIASVAPAGEKRLAMEPQFSLCPAPSVSATRRTKRGTGAFFWFVFFHAKENEQTTGFIQPRRG